MDSSDQRDRPQLFRQQAVEARFGAAVAHSRIVTPPAFKAYAIAISVVVALAVLSAATLAYTRTERVQGYLAPDRGLVRVHPHRPGVIEHRHVVVGDRVHPGQVLFVVGSDQADRSGNTLFESTQAFTRHAISELEQQIQRLERQGELEQARAAVEIAQRRAEIAGQEDLLAIQRQRSHLLQDQLDSLERLKRSGHLAKHDYVSRRLSLLTEAETVRATEGKREALKSAVAAATLQAQAQRLDIENRISQLLAQAVTLKKLLLSESGEQQSAVVATVGGRVAAVQADVGQQVWPASALLTIVPEEARMHAELVVPASSIAHIALGQTVYLAYHGFSARDSERQRATVTQISPVALDAAEFASPSPLEEPAYRVIATLESASYSFQGREIPMLPGMRFDADIVIDRHPLLAQLLRLRS